ncbi:MAG: response regulator transcription factor [Actinobacteria bacterium]|nr:response regulator transcription factor [Actinomycetota bacterium]MBI3686349.1 response regulator transcription factor [Actinomycetota bacterium]
MVVDDSALLREGVARLLADAGFVIVSTHADTQGLLAHLTGTRPDLLVIDIRMPPTHTTEGLQAALAVRRDLPGTAVLVLSQHVETRLAVDLIADRSDGVGYLLKDRIADLSEFIEAAHRLCRGGSAIDPHVVSRLLGRERRNNPLTRLTEREREVLAHMAEGRSNQAIATALTLTERTVEAHVRNLFTKLDLAPEADDHRRVRAVLLHLQSIDA